MSYEPEPHKYSISIEVHTNGRIQLLNYDPYGSKPRANGFSCRSQHDLQNLDIFLRSGLKEMIISGKGVSPFFFLTNCAT